METVAAVRCETRDRPAETRVNFEEAGSTSQPQPQLQPRSIPRAVQRTGSQTVILSAARKSGALAFATIAAVKKRANRFKQEQSKRQALNLSPDGRLRTEHVFRQESSRLKQELDALSLQNHERASAPWYLVDPGSSRVAMWDLLTALTLLVVLAFTPFEVAFLESPTVADDPVFILGRVIDLIFLGDMVLQFFQMVPKAGEPGKLETSHKVIVREYLRGWFVLDVFSLGASVFDFLPLFPDAFGDAGSSVGGGSRQAPSAGADGGTGAGAGASAGESKKSPLAFLRIVRALRLVKLVRLLRASRRLKEWSTKIATPRATLVMVSTIVECLFVIHLFACALGVMTITAPSPLDTWYATHGYCAYKGVDVYGVRISECVDPLELYFQCVWWSAGMLMGAPISLTPNQGPYPRYYSPSEATRRWNATSPLNATAVYDEGVADEGVLLTKGEQSIVLALKMVTALLWVTVIARVVQVYNNLDPDSAEFRRGWDDLNKFISYFKFTNVDAQELRRYYIERAEEAKANSRRRVIRDFSPYLAEKFVWKLNRDWLTRVPCFSLVVERLNEHVVRGTDSGMERFLVKVAMQMMPAVYVPTERPPPNRLYIITEGAALHRGRRITKGDSWGAEDVLLKGARLASGRAVAISYLHTIWIAAETFDRLAVEFREGYMLTKLWASIYAAGEAIIEDYRLKTKSRKPVRIGEEPGMVAKEVVEKQINMGLTKVVEQRSQDGRRKINERGQPLYALKWQAIDISGYEIVKERVEPPKDQHDSFTKRVSPRLLKKSAITAGRFVVQKQRRNDPLGPSVCQSQLGRPSEARRPGDAASGSLAELSAPSVASAPPPASFRSDGDESFTQRPARPTILRDPGAWLSGHRPSKTGLAQRVAALTKRVERQNTEVLAELAELAAELTNVAGAPTSAWPSQRKTSFTDGTNRGANATHFEAMVSASSMCSA